jgi:hypothetical protein
MIHANPVRMTQPTGDGRGCARAAIVIAVQRLVMPQYEQTDA